MVDSFPDLSILPFLRSRLKDRSRIDLNGEIFSWGGGSSLISSQSTSLACPTLTFSALSVAKCASASGDRDDWWGPQATASHISSFDHGLPVFVGHPSCDHSKNSSPAGCNVAMPAGHISLRYSSGRSCRGGRDACPVWVDHSIVGTCCSCSAWRLLLFCSLNLSVSAPVTSSLV